MGSDRGATLALLSACAIAIAAPRCVLADAVAPWDGSATTMRRAFTGRQAAAAGHSRGDAALQDYTLHWHNCTTDHFGFLPLEPFPLRYFVNDTHWDKAGGGPIFLYTGNEASISEFIKNTVRGRRWSCARVHAARPHYEPCERMRGAPRPVCRYAAASCVRFSNQSRTRPRGAASAASAAMLAHPTPPAQPPRRPLWPFADATSCGPPRRVAGPTARGVLRPHRASCWRLRPSSRPWSSLSNIGALVHVCVWVGWGGVGGASKCVC